jgi:hypothetical protein
MAMKSAGTFILRVCMDILTRLWRFIGSVIALTGPIVRLLETYIRNIWPSLPPLALDIFSIIAVYIGVIIVICSDKREREALEKKIEERLRDYEEKLRDYTVPDQFAKLPIAETPFARAIRALVDYSARQHEHGSLPTYAGMEITITTRALLDGEVPRELNIPEVPNDYSWLWFHFNIKRSWTIKPNSIGSEVSFDPQKYFVDEVIVMSYPTYLALYDFTNPRRIIFYPIPSRVFEEEPLKRALASGRYLSLKFQVTKWSKDNKPLSDPVELEIQSRVFRNRNQKEEAIVETFRSIKQRPALLKQACDGIYEIHKVIKKEISDKVYIYPHEEGTFWRYQGEYNLILPAKVIRDGKLLWDQQWFELVFERISTVKKIVFCKIDDSRLEFRQDRYPILLCFPRLQDPTKVKVTLTNDKWEIEIEDSSDKFWYPGDTVLFYWHDTLISEKLLSAQSSK